MELRDLFQVTEVGAILGIRQKDGFLTWIITLFGFRVYADIIKGAANATK
jgi:hypothetical protein